MAEYKTEHDNLDKMSVEDRVSAASDHTEINCFELKNVCAGYDTNNVLHDISIRLPAGRNVCILGEKGVLVRFGVYGHSGDAQLPAGAHHPDGYLSPIGDEDLIEHPLS